MELVFTEVAATVAPAGSPGTEVRAPLGGDPAARTVLGVGPVEMTLERHAAGFMWSVANRGDGAVPLRNVAVVLRVEGVTEPLRMFRHGYQSWSSSGVVVLGQHRDPSQRADFPFIQGVYHADAQRVPEGEVRSEWCTALDDAAPGGPRSSSGSTEGTATTGPSA